MDPTGTPDEIRHATRLDAWVAYGPNGGGVVVFSKEIVALRYAVAEGGMKVRRLRDGVALADLMALDAQEVTT